MKLGFATLFLLFISFTMGAQSITGDWKGAIDVQGNKLDIVFHINGTDGNLTATMDVPAQGAAGIPVDKTEFSNNKLNLKVSAAGIGYSGELTGDEISGNFEQAGMKLPLVLKKFESKLPGNTALPSTNEDLAKLADYDKGNFKYSVADYFARPKASAFQLSPNGKYMAYREKDDNNKRHVFVKELSTGKVTKAIEEKEELVRGYGFINDERLFYSMDKGGDENYHIYAANLDGSNTKDLTPFDSVKAGIINILKEQKNFIIISMNKNNKQVFEPYKLNVVTGELAQLLKIKILPTPSRDTSSTSTVS